jgi:hypothetical protein
MNIYQGRLFNLIPLRIKKSRNGIALVKTKYNVAVPIKKYMALIRIAPVEMEPGLRVCSFNILVWFSLIYCFYAQLSKRK